jgi:CysZ protein
MLRRSIVIGDGCATGANPSEIAAESTPEVAASPAASQRDPPVFRALPLAFAQLADRSSRRVLALSIASTLALLIALVVLTGWLLGGVTWLGIGWLDGLIGALGTLAAVILAGLLFPAVLAAMTGLWVDAISDAVEARYYPGLPPPRSRATIDGLVAGLRLAGFALVLNLVLLPLYFVPGLNLVLFYGANGYLVARAYFEQVAVRRLALPETRALFGRHRVQFWLAGVIITFMTTVPILNLVVPIVATALMTHLLEDLRRR